jgi:CPA2 family monovalent cation:H+ antiporter-2
VPLLACCSCNESHAHGLKRASASFVIPETLETGLPLSAFVLHTMSMGEGATACVKQGERDRRIADLQNGLGRVGSKEK